MTCRIKTVIGARTLTTLYSPETSKWVTIVKDTSKRPLETFSQSSESFEEAGKTHLTYCKAYVTLQEAEEELKKVTDKMLGDTGLVLDLTDPIKVKINQETLS